MTGTSPVLDRPALWAALSHMQIDLPGTARRFEERLAEEQGWPLDFATRVTGEYRRFLYLAATANVEVTPSQAVDEAWHFHLTLPHYRDILCERILGRPLDHRPGSGAPEDEERYARQYAETLALYAQVFGRQPPRDVWPNPGFEGEYLPSSRQRARRIGRSLAAASLVGSLAAMLSGAFVVAILLFGAAVVLFLFSYPAFAAKRGDGSAGCGAAGCGGSCSSSDNGGASCSGGSCGGGGCGGGGD